MKERWPEMLEYQQKVQAMTDLERAQFWLDATTGLIFPEAGVVASLASLIAAARREGAEEMRERARRATTFCCFECSRVIAALPLTPEEPT